LGAWVAAVSLGVVAGVVGFGPPALAAPPKKPATAGAPGPKKGGGDPPAVGTAVLRLVVPELDETRACYTRELEKDPTIAGEVVVHAIVEASGKTLDAGAYQVRATRIESWDVMRKRVARCVTKRVAALELPPFADGMARKIVIAFRFAPGAAGAVGTPGAAGAAGAAGALEAARVARAVVAGESVGYARASAQLIHRYCWRDDSDRESCTVRFIDPSHQIEKQLPIPDQPGKRPTKVPAAEDDDPSMRLAESFASAPVIDLAAVEWPDDAAAVVLPDLGVALSAAGGHIDIGRSGPDGEEIKVPRLELRGGKAAHLVAVHWAPGANLVVIAARRPAAPGLGDPPSATSVSDLETIVLARPGGDR
jgi:hypothetical protein